MPSPSDHETLCRWRHFVISRSPLNLNIWMARVQATFLGTPIHRADFLSLARDYRDQRSENKSRGRRG
ncbi:MAG TPA: hypothetical protein VIF61_00785 [Methylocystis sp.]